MQLFHTRHARGEVMTEAELDAVLDANWSSEGFISREHEEGRLAAGRAALRRFREDQLRPDAVIPTYVEREFSFQLGGDRVRGRWDRVDVEPVADAGDASVAAASSDHDPSSPSADVISPTLGMLGRERVTITDYKSSDVRDPVRARQRARDSLQLQIYAMGYEAMTGRLPDAVALHFLDSGLVGKVEVDRKRLAKARDKIDDGGRGDPCPRLPRHPGPDGVLVVRLPGHLPGERGPLIRALPADTACASLDSTRRGAHRRPPSSSARISMERRSTMQVERLVRPWATDGSDILDSLVMETRDRLINLAVFAAAAIVWVLVGLVVLTRDPVADPAAGVIGAALIGLAIALTAVPILWLVVFGRHRRIAYQGDWTRAARRGAWIGLVVGIFIVLRLQGALELPIALFIVTLAVVAEATLSVER